MPLRIITTVACVVGPPGRVGAKRQGTLKIGTHHLWHCILQEGFSAASARHIIERAGASWDVIQHHFGDRDGPLTAVIDDAMHLPCIV
jgi:hypothetical protein